MDVDRLLHLSTEVLADLYQYGQRETPQVGQYAALHRAGRAIMHDVDAPWEAVILHGYIRRQVHVRVVPEALEAVVGAPRRRVDDVEASARVVAAEDAAGYIEVVLTERVEFGAEPCGHFVRRLGVSQPDSRAGLAVLALGPFPGKTGDSHSATSLAQRGRVAGGQRQSAATRLGEEPPVLGNGRRTEVTHKPRSTNVDGTPDMENGLQIDLVREAVEYKLRHQGCGLTVFRRQLEVEKVGVGVMEARPPRVLPRPLRRVEAAVEAAVGGLDLQHDPPLGEHVRTPGTGNGDDGWASKVDPELVLRRRAEEFVSRVRGVTDIDEVRRPVAPDEARALRAGDDDQRQEKEHNGDQAPGRHTETSSVMNRQARGQFGTDRCLTSRIGQDRTARGPDQRGSRLT